MKRLFWSLRYKWESWKFERRCIKHLGIKPTRMYLSTEDYDALVEVLNKPPDPAITAKLRDMMSKRAPWDES